MTISTVNQRSYSQLYSHKSISEEDIEKGYIPGLEAKGRSRNGVTKKVRGYSIICLECRRGNGTKEDILEYLLA